MKITLIHLGAYERLYKQFRIAPPTFAALASTIPPDWEVEFIDESIQEIDYSIETDVVGISLITPNAYRGYEIAKRFREKGRFVVFGGYHPTVMPDEALEHGDAVVIGEGELALADLLNDFKKGKTKKKYKKPVEDLSQLPFQNKTIFDAKRYSFPNSFQASRGCAYSCDYCIMRKVFPGYRMMEPDRIIDELKNNQIGNFLQRKVVYFLDENIASNRDYAKDLFTKLKDLKLIWSSSSTINFAEDEELVKLAYKAGCRSLFIGIESFNEKSLKSARKVSNDVKRYKENIKRLHDNGIAVYGGLVFGFEEDDASVFDDAYEKTTDMGIDILQTAILTPLPGTDYYNKLEEEGRLLTKDWSLYDGFNVVYKPNKMTVEELQEGAFKLRDRFFSIPNILNRVLLKSRTSIHYTLLPNFVYRNFYKKNLRPCELPDKIRG
ncbi:MAG: B12-binding domain-containing radical SAM protein [bacterium]|nr:B12-binding domain-containing radical SAM protein [bacterium]